MAGSTADTITPAQKTGLGSGSPAMARSGTAGTAGRGGTEGTEAGSMSVAVEGVGSMEKRVAWPDRG
jgi:hypothetical protein